MSYYICEWTESGGKATAQTDKGKDILERHAGVYVGSGKIMLSMRLISEREFENNKRSGVKTI